MKYYSAIKRNKLSFHKKKKKKRNLKCTLLSKSSQSEKTIYYMIPTIEHSENHGDSKKISGYHRFRGGRKKVKNKWSAWDV